MENRRFILLAVFGVICFFIYQAWQKEHGAKPEQMPPETAAAAATRAEAATIDPDLPRAAGVPDAPVTAVTAATTQRIKVYTDLYVAEIALTGADLRRLELIGYPVSKKNPEDNIALLNDRDGHYFVLQSGLAGTDRAIGSQFDTFTAEQTEYRMAEGADVLEVPLDYQDASGTRMRKLYRFHRGLYEIELEQRVVNAGAAPLKVSPYVRMTRTPVAAGDEPPFVKTFLGLGVYEAKPDSDSYRFHKVAFKDLGEEPYDKQQKGGWLAMLQHYFVAAILPPVEETHSFSGKPGKERGYVAQYLGPASDVAAQGEQVFSTKLYIGPKLQDSIGKAAKGLELTVDYGILTAISEPLFWLLNWLHKYLGNWGLAIIVLTLLVKAAFYKLSEAQYRSMAKMKKFAPRIADLKERYGDDRERMSKAMMDLYKKEGFNPLAGCWPLLVQMPVFFALYWVFLESVELRQADFFLWINDLTSPDPFFVLPVLYGISMFVMQRLSGQSATMDPMQQKIMNVMPIALTGFFTFFPAGLVLYWLVSNLIGIAQQWYITRKINNEGLAKAA